MSDHILPVGHAVSLGAIVGSLAGWLPHIAAVLSIVWFFICIYESRTVQHWKSNYTMRRRARKLAKLKAREKVVIAQITALETVRAAKVEAREMVADAKVEATKLMIHEDAKL